ncbi:hypothetical protein QYF36_014359 [Acer negundo]|nr:hypothetical protein QYF36_014359 [Acer negundo]
MLIPANVAAQERANQLLVFFSDYARVCERKAASVRKTLQWQKPPADFSFKNVTDVESAEAKAILMHWV